MSQMTAVQIHSPGGSFEVVKREILAPGANQVRIKVPAVHSGVAGRDRSGF
jgi:D-arabinose 1-dehydrogenase-like Zn-dependent alcohol dehydrogenase